MKQPPKAFIDLLDEEEKKLSENTKYNRQQEIQRDEAASVLFSKNLHALEAYNDVTILGHHITIKNNQKFRKIEFYIDGRIWLLMRPEWNMYTCSCEYPCDHSSSWTLGWEVEEQHHSDETLGIIFCYDWFNPKALAQSIRDTIKSFEFESIMGSWK